MNAATGAERAHDNARIVLLNAMLSLLKALQKPELRQQLLSAAHGATRAGGARVPGTSFEFDPPQAADGMRLLLQTLDEGHPAQTLPAILAESDARARQAMLAGSAPPTMRELFAEWINACGSASLAAHTALADRAGFAQVVTQIYPLKQQPLLLGLFDDPAALDAMPVQAFMAAFVRNG